MPALAQTNPWLVSLMMRSPRRRRMRTDSCSTRGLWESGSSGSTANEAVLGLRHDLLGHDHDVAVGELGVVAEHGGLGDEPGQVGADGDLGDAVEAEDGEPAHGVSSVVTPTAASVVRASEAAVSGVRMTVGVTTQRMPSASTSATRSASASSMTRVPAKGA